MRKITLISACLLLLAAAPLASAQQSFVCVKNEAWVVLKVCQAGNNCHSGIVRGETLRYPSQGDDVAPLLLNVYYSDGSIYKHFKNVELKDRQSYVISGNVFKLSGKVVDGSCSAAGMEIKK